LLYCEKIFISERKIWAGNHVFGAICRKIDIFSTYIFYARNLQNFIAKFKFPSVTSAAARMLLRCFTLLV